EEETLSQGRVLRKRSQINYAESDAETNSDSDYVIKGKSKKRVKRQGKVSHVNISEETSKPFQEQQTITSLGMEDIITLRQCPLIRSADQASNLTPNKPIVTRMMYDEYFPYLICAFNNTINYLKETTENKTFMEIKKIQKMNDQLILQESFIRKLEVIFETDYSKIESKIIEETTIKDGDQTEDARFNFFIRYTLLDFAANFRYKIPRVLDCDMSERTFIVECLSPIFRAFRNAFPDIKYGWIEKDVTSIKVTNNMFEYDISSRKVDLLIQRLSDNMEVMNTEVSGSPFKTAQPHAVGDIKKLLMMSVCNLCQLFRSNLDCSVKDAKGVRTYSIQVIGDRLTLFSVSLIDRKKYLAIELATCIIPFSFDSISHFTKIFSFFKTIRNEFKEQEKLRKKISNPADNITERVRDWLFLPDDAFFYDLKTLPEDIDEGYDMIAT
ncbi:1444_t:CDS:2, partial [Funneliformis mosseae]